MNKIFFVLPCVVVYSFVCTSENTKQPSPMRDGVRRKLSNPVERVKAGQQFDSFITKNESPSPRDIYQSIQDNQIKKMQRDKMTPENLTMVHEFVKRRSSSIDHK